MRKVNEERKERSAGKGEGDVEAHEYYNDIGFIFYTKGTSLYGQALLTFLT